LLDAIGRWLFAPLEADHEADAPLPMHNASQAWSVLYAKFVDGTAGGHTRTDASDMSTLLMDMPWLVRGAQSRFPTGADKAKLAAAMDREISFCLDAVNAASGARWLEIAACYEGRLTRNEMSLHSEFHTNALGGDAALARPNVDPTVDPLTFFHHTAGDRLRAQWQYRQRELRPIAYGYPVQDGYNLTRSGLYDCVGCDAYGLGFDMQGLQGLQAGQYLGSATAADMLCSGEFELLYTYDVILAEARAEVEAQWAPPKSSDVGTMSAMLVLAVWSSLVLVALCRRVRASQMAGYSKETALNGLSQP